jgi:hypothetical protein
MKQYFAFYGDCYYPIGGMDDFVGDYDTKEEPIEAIEKAHLENRPDDKVWELAWCNVWDSKDRIEVHTK